MIKLVHRIKTMCKFSSNKVNKLYFILTNQEQKHLRQAELHSHNAGTLSSDTNRVWKRRPEVDTGKQSCFSRCLYLMYSVHILLGNKIALIKRHNKSQQQWQSRRTALWQGTGIHKLLKIFDDAFKLLLTTHHLTYTSANIVDTFFLVMYNG